MYEDCLGMNRPWNFVSILGIGAVLLAQSSLGLERNTAVPTLEVAGNSSAFRLSPEFLHQLERSKVEVPASEKEPASVYEGIWLHDLLSHAGVPEGTAIRSEERRVGKECRSRW